MNKIAFILIMFISASFAQIINQSSTQSILKGKITDEKGNPVGLEISIQPKKGAKFIIKSDPTTGAYEQLLNSEEKYIFAFIHPEYLRENFEVIVPKPDEDFNPIIRDFKATKLIAGNTLKTANIFEPGSDQLSGKGKKFVNELKKLLRFNRSISLNFQVYGENGLDQKRLKTIQSFTEKFKRMNRSVIYSAGGKGSSDNDVALIIDKVTLD